MILTVSHGHTTSSAGASAEMLTPLRDPHTGIYHRFYQYDPTYTDQRMHGRVPRTWGHTISRDLATWEDWPGIYADSPWDEEGVFSGNCEGS